MVHGMKTDEQRRDDIRDEMLIDMARGIQLMLGVLAPSGVSAAMNIIGRLESHIALLRGEK
jgi:hypothetical protein